MFLIAVSTRHRYLNGCALNGHSSCVFSLKIIYFPYFYWFHKIYCRLVLLVCEITSGPSFPRVVGCRWPIAAVALPQCSPPHRQYSVLPEILVEGKTREKTELPEGDQQKGPQQTTQRILFCTYFYKCKMELIQTGFGGGVKRRPFFTRTLTNEQAQGQLIWWGQIQPVFVNYKWK